MYHVLNLILIIGAVRTVVSFDGTPESKPAVVSPDSQSKSKPEEGVQPKESVQPRERVQQQEEIELPPEWVGTKEHTECKNQFGYVMQPIRGVVYIGVPYWSKTQQRWCCTLNANELRPILRQYGINWQEFEGQHLRTYDGKYGRQYLKEHGVPVGFPNYNIAKMEKDYKKELRKELGSTSESSGRFNSNRHESSSSMSTTSAGNSKRVGSSGSWFNRKRTGTSLPRAPSRDSSTDSDSSEESKTSETPKSSKKWWSFKKQKADSPGKGDLSKGGKGSLGASKGSSEGSSNRSGNPTPEALSRQNSMGSNASSQPGSPNPEALRRQNSDSSFEWAQAGEGVTRQNSMASDSSSESAQGQGGPSREGSFREDGAGKGGSLDRAESSMAASDRKAESTEEKTYTKEQKECTNHCNTVQGYIVINPGYSRIAITKGILSEFGKKCECKLNLADTKAFLEKRNLDPAEFFDAFEKDAEGVAGRQWLTSKGFTVDFRKTLEQRFNEQDALSPGEITPA